MRFDIVIVGGGKGGKSLALALAPTGKKVALIESKMLGGSCINVACIPTKTMVSGTRLVHDARQAKSRGFNIEVGENLKPVIARKRAVVEAMVKTHLDLFTKTENLTFYKGMGRFLDSSTVEVTLEDGKVEQIQGDKIFINTGTRPLLPEIPGLLESGVLTSTSIMELDYLPEHLAIIGGGYIALEFAQIFRRLGSQVTLLERSNHFLPREDSDIANCVKDILTGEGIEIMFDVVPEKVTTDGADKILQLKTKEGTREFRCSDILSATGRAAVNETLNLEAIGVECDARGFIKVNESLETSVKNIWAIGDCKGGPFFTHASWDDYRILKDNILYDAGCTTRDRLVPYTLFVEPELGRVGLTEAEARQKGLDIKVAVMPAAKVPRANTEGESRGMLKAIVDAKSRQILGFAALCHGGGEIASCVQVAMLAGMPYDQLRNVIFSHPTMCESLNLLFAGI